MPEVPQLHDSTLTLSLTSSNLVFIIMLSIAGAPLAYTFWRSLILQPLASLWEAGGMSLPAAIGRPGSSRHPRDGWGGLLFE